MIDGNAVEFIDGLYYGDERWFVYADIKYFIQGWHRVEEDSFTLVLEQIDPDPETPYCLWSDTKPFIKRRDVVDNFLQAKIFDGKAFWEIEHAIKWVDC